MRSIPCRICRKILLVMAERAFFDLRNIMIRINIAKTETGKIVAAKKNVPLYKEELLIEQNYGIYEGVDRKDPQILNNKRNFAYRYPGGESMMQVACRIYGFLERIKEEYPEKNILLISHGGVCRIIRTYFTDMTNEQFFHYTLENAKCEEYEM